MHKNIPNASLVERVTKAAHPTPRLAFFDLDGTVGLIRAGWQRVMTAQALTALRATGTQETDAELLAVIEEYIFRLTGKPTILQMASLAENVAKRGGVALTADQYKQEFLAELSGESDRRTQEIEANEHPHEYHMVPGVRMVLEELRDRGVRMYLVSGTDEDIVREDVRLFDIARYFDGGIYGSPGDDSPFTKRGLVQEVVGKGDVRPEEMLTFGDGFAEIEAMKEAGGVAIGLATHEPECLLVDEWKRERLIASGADYIIPNYLCWPELRGILFDGQ